MPGLAANPETWWPELARRLLAEAIASAQPAQCLPPYLAALQAAQAPPAAQARGRVLVIGAGKASAAMAQALEASWQGAPLSGLVVTRRGYAARCRQIEVIEAGHPLPDAAGLRAGARMLELVRGLAPEDQVIALISGGGSALLVSPLPGLTLEDKQSLTGALLNCGASISEINCVRRHLSAVKGGRLAAACHPAHVLTLAISDVPGDDPADIASGPTVADASRRADAMAILRRYRLAVPSSVMEVLALEGAESVKPTDPRLAGHQVHLLATPQRALEAAARAARAVGIAAVILSDRIEGEAREVARVMAAIARQVSVHREPWAPPLILLSGGETSVTVRGGGRGGRNVEFLLALGLALAGEPGIYALAADTDGVDGSEEIAGALLSPDTLARAAARGIDARTSLDANDAHGFFGAIGDAVVTGPTRTNVNDFRAILIVPHP